MILNVNLPMTGKASRPAYNPVEIQQRLSRLKALYGDAFEQAYTLNNIPDQLLAAIILIENYDLVADSVHVNSRPVQNAVGLGQIKPYSATDIVSRSKRKRLLTDPKRAVLQKQLGTRLAYIEAHLGTTEPVITQTDLKNAELNLMLMGMYLSQLVGESQENGICRMDKVGYRYNQGYSAKMPKDATTADALLDSVSGEGRIYILRLVGRNGVLAALTN